MKLSQLVTKIYQAVVNNYGKDYEVFVIEEGTGADTHKDKLMYFQNSDDTKIKIVYDKQTKIGTYSKEVQLVVQTTDENPDQLADKLISILLRFSNDITYDINPANAFKDATKNDLKKLNINYILFTFVVNKVQIKEILCSTC